MLGAEREWKRVRLSLVFVGVYRQLGYEEGIKWITYGRRGMRSLYAINRSSMSAASHRSDYYFCEPSHRIASHRIPVNVDG